MVLRSLVFAFIFFAAVDLFAETIEYKIEFDIDNVENINEINSSLFKGDSRNLNIDQENFLSSEISYIFAVNEAVSFNLEIESIKSFAVNPNDSKAENILNQRMKVVDIGIYRGVKLKKITIKPFLYDPENGRVELLTNAKLIFNINLIQKREQVSLRNFGFITNKGHIPYLINKNETPKFLEDYTKLDLNNKYLKILTKSDRIYKISFEEIIGKLNNVSGKNINNIRLLNRGNDVPLYIKSDDNRISSDDYLYFYGKHRRSDTTYYNFYGLEEAYFLFYDEDQEGLNYSESNLTGDFQEIESVDVTYHYEKDSIYFYYEMDSEQYHHEGWYWGEVFPDTKYTSRSEFAPKLFISPSENINDEINIKAYYKSYKDIYSNNPITKYTYNLDFIINNSFFDNDIFQGFKHGTFSAELNNESIFYGLNEIKIKANETNPDRDKSSGIDYISISGKMNPQAVNERLNFIYQTDNAEKINIKNFNNDEIVAVNDNNIFFPERITGVNFNIGALANRGMSIGINDEFIHGSESAVYLIAVDENVIKVNSISNENDVINRMKDLPDNSPFAFIAYQTNSISSFSSSLNNFGASRNSEFKAGDIYVLAGIKGSSDIIEDLNTESININEFFENPFSDFASAEFNIPANTNENYFVSNIADDSEYELISVSENNLYEEKPLDYLIITHEKFADGIKKLADYRNETKGINYSIVKADDIYNQFGDGIKSPFAIRNYINYVYYNYPAPKVSDILLVGDATWDPRKNLKVSIGQNFLPSYGMPVSDYWFTLVDGDDLLPDINIGRLPANDDTELNNMISKIITYDTVKVKSWMKEMLFLSGGTTEDEIRRFKDRIPYIKEDILEPAPMGGKGTEIIRSAANASGEENAGEIRSEINEGKFWTNFLGHASSEIFDMDGWQVETLNNNKRFGILTTLSCNTGAFAEPPLRNCRNETYIKAKDKGFVATISGTATGYVGYHWDIFKSMVEAFADTNLRYRKIGDILTYSKIKNNDFENPFRKHTAYQMTILGDPLTSLRLDDNTDLFLDGNEIHYFNEDNATVFSDDNEVINIQGFINNNGYCTDSEFDLTVIREVENFDYTDTLNLSYEGICFNEEFDISLPVLNMSGEHRISLEVDPKHIIDDDKRYNNKYEIIVNVLSQSLIGLEPQNAGNMYIDEPVFRFINPLSAENETIEYEFYITDKKDSENHLISSKNNDISVNSTHIDWIPNLSSLDVGNNYWLKAGYKRGKEQAKWIWKNFKLHSGSITEENEWNVEKTDQFEEFLRAKSINIDISEFNNITLKSDTIPYKMISFIGDKSVVPNIKSWIDIQIGENVYSVGEFWRGFHIVTLPVDISKGRGKHRRFDTWGGEDSHGDDFWKDSSAYKFVEFLQDSVQRDEYLFVSSSHSSFRMFRKHYEDQPESKGNLDSLIKALKVYGATLADSLNDGDIIRTDDATYQIVSRLGNDKPIEKLIFTKDSLITSENIFRHNLKATVTTDLIGPAKKWNSLKLDGEFNDNQSVEVFVIGISDTSEDTLVTADNFDEIDLSSIDASKYLNIKISVDIFVNTIDFNGFDEIEKPKLTNLNVNYIPLPEIALVPDSVYMYPDSVLIGQPTSVKYSLRNLSLRTNAENIEYRITGMKEKGEIFFENYNGVASLQKNSEVENLMDIPTDDIDLKNYIYGDISSNDSYSFNNSFTKNLVQINDVLKPYARIKSDGKYISNGDFISAKPTIEIELFDNSFINSFDSTKISARLNGYYHPSNRTEYSEFESVDDSSLKAVFTFRPDTIEYEDILLFVYIADAANNRDTIRMSLNTSLRRSDISEVLSVPNPFSDATEIEFLLKTPKTSGDAQILIYDAIGNLVRILESEVTAGRNSVIWDGRMENGAEVPVGSYHYKINILNMGFVEPVNGKVIKVK